MTDRKLSAVAGATGARGVGLAGAIRAIGRDPSGLRSRTRGGSVRSRTTACPPLTGPCTRPQFAANAGRIPGA